MKKEIKFTESKMKVIEEMVKYMESIKISSETLIVKYMETLTSEDIKKLEPYYYDSYGFINPYHFLDVFISHLHNASLGNKKEVSKLYHDFCKMASKLNFCEICTLQDTEKCERIDRKASNFDKKEIKTIKKKASKKICPFCIIFQDEKKEYYEKVSEELKSYALKEQELIKKLEELEKIPKSLLICEKIKELHLCVIRGEW